MMNSKSACRFARRKLSGYHSDSDTTTGMLFPGLYYTPATAPGGDMSRLVPLAALFRLAAVTPTPVAELV
ncbi:MAG: hypothetical protein ACE15E_23680, partial [Acidobacteriota bacterium]